MKFLDPFRSQNHFHLPLVIVFLLINGIVLMNVLLHDPTVGYDAVSHLQNIETYASLHIPGKSNSREFFAPPLPYLFPASLIWLKLANLRQAIEVAQFLNVSLSVLLTYYLIRVCDLLRPGQAIFKTTALAVLGMLPVYYKSFAQVRGEPFVACFAVLAVYLALQIFREDQAGWPRLLALGGVLGMAVNARQWAFLFFPAIFLFAAWGSWPDRGKTRSRLRAALVILAVSFAIGAPFYLRLYAKYGTFLAFNRKPEAAFSLSNQPLRFYFGLGDGKLFSDPVRPNFPNQFWPIFYSELWGDYWSYFTIYGRDIRTQAILFGPELSDTLNLDPLPAWLDTNRYTDQGYLGRVNLVSIFPTLLLAAGMILGIREILQFVRFPAGASAGWALASLVAWALWVFYAWFLVQYPNLDKGDTIKATYLLHTFPFVALLAARVLEAVRRRLGVWYWFVVTILALIALHNLPVMFSKY